jgi:translation initiation factor IF-2
LATVRIYKVAELLNTTSQEVVALLKRDHGIEVKSASSTIEEVVARQFVDRMARQRGISLPGGDMFAETPVHKPKKPGVPKKAEPPRPVAPALPPPRLVKTIRPKAEGEAEPHPEAVPATPATAAPHAEPVTPSPAADAAKAEPPAPPAPVAAPAPPKPVELRLETPPAPEVKEPAPPHVVEPEPIAPVAAAPAAPVGPVVPVQPPAPEPVAVAPAAPAPAAPVPQIPAAEAPAPASHPPAAQATQAAAPHAPTPQAAPGAPRLVSHHPPASAPGRPAAGVPARPVPPAAERMAARPTPPPTPRPVMPPPGRVVPPRSGLRVEQTPPPPVPRLQPRTVAPPALPPRPGPTGQVGRPAPRPAMPDSSRMGARPGALPPRPAPVSAQRPMPSQPTRPGQPPSGAPPRPGAPRPGQPSRPPMGGRPAPGQRQHGGTRREAPRVPPMSLPSAPPPITRTITLAEGMTVKDLADKLELRTKDVLKKLLDKRIMMTINTTLDVETATMIAREFGAEVQVRSFEEELLEVETEDAHPEDRVTRAPVVTVMGHVDHGKTTLLDGIRETRVAEREAGGITQHIGAYHVQVNNRSVVFLDTPGHEAFTLMRARGARVTDIVILVVAADDGVMPQTREAIDHAKAAGVPIIVAINKVDKPDSNPERVKRELSDLGLMPEEWGGQTVMVEVSAKKRQNLELLLEMILLVTDIGDLKANPKRSAVGTVLEAQLDKGRGPVATILVQDGTLHIGDTVIAGPILGKVRALIDDRGRHVKAAGPSIPVEVLGLAALPQPGDSFQAINDAAKARQVALFRQTQAKEKAAFTKTSRLTLESLQQQIAEGDVKELPIIIKADVQGSAEVLADTLTKLSDEKVKIRIIHSGVGAINESDVLLASASNAIIIGFSVRPDRNAVEVAEREHVDVRLHSIIYNVIDEMKKAMAGLLEPTFKEVRLGMAEVREVFRVPKIGSIAGCMVVDGTIKRSGDAQARLLRDNVVVFEGKIGGLRRFKDDVSEVKSGFECGISLERFNDVKVGDAIEVFVVERVIIPATA